MTVLELLVDGMRRHRHLTSIDLAGTNIRDRGVAHLASWLPDASALQTLDLRWNHLTDDSATSLARGLKKRSGSRRCSSVAWSFSLTVALSTAYLPACGIAAAPF